jgi:hypothetical protein
VPARSPRYAGPKELGIGQDDVSKLEKRADLMISTLKKTVEAMGGSLSLVAEFPDREPGRPSTYSRAEPAISGNCHNIFHSAPYYH